MSLQVLLPTLRKIRVLYVDDPSSTGSETDEALRRSEARAVSGFWSRASQFCPSHPPELASDQECPACPFALKFFNYFPQACYDLLSGNDYDVFLVDIHADNVPGNIWDDRLYDDAPLAAKARLKKLFPELRPASTVNGNHVISLIARLPHRVRTPFVAWTSLVEDPRKSLDLDLGVVASVSRKDADNLKWLLPSAIHWIAPQIVEGFSVSPPSEEGLSPKRSVILDFQKEALEIAAGVPIETSTGRSVLIDPTIAGGDKISVPMQSSVTHAWPFRFLMRGGKIPDTVKKDLQVFPARLFNETAVARLKSEHASLGELLEDFGKHLSIDSRKTLSWDRDQGLPVHTTVDLAWGYLYHSVVRLFRSEGEAGIETTEFKGSTLASDSLRVSSHGCLETARRYIERAIEIGGDPTAKQITDLEFLWVAPLVRAAILNDAGACGALSRAFIELVVAGRSSTLEDRRRIALMLPWLQCDHVFAIRDAAQAVSEGEDSLAGLKVTIFRAYREGRSLHARLKELPARRRGASHNAVAGS